MAKRRFFLLSLVSILAVFLCAFVAFLFLRDLFLTQALEKRAKAFLPGADLAVTGLHLGHNSFAIKKFDIIRRRGQVSPVELNEGGLDSGFSLATFFVLPGDPLLALERLSLRIRQFRFNELTAKEIHLSAARKNDGNGLAAELKFSSLAFAKMKISDASIKARVFSGEASVDEALARLFGGSVSGKGRVVFSQGSPDADLSLDVKEVQIGDLMRALDADKRMEITGTYSGIVSAKMEDGEVRELTGDLKSVTGGKMIVKDPSLMNTGSLKGQPANLVVENLMNYYYDIGNIQVRNEGQNIKIGIFLKGPSGQRNLEVFWHRPDPGKGTGS